MSWNIILGLVGTLGVPAASGLYITIRDRKKDHDKDRRTTVDDDKNLRDDQREYIRVLSNENRELRQRMTAIEDAREDDRRRIGALERGRAEDHHTINALRDYLRRVLGIIPAGVTVPPAPPELLDD